jgi:hypothetical protein
VRNVDVSLRISIEVKFFKTLMNPGVVQGQKEHNNKNQMKSLDRELYEYCYLGLHKKLNSSRYRVHCLSE